MENIQLFISQVCCGKAPADWTLGTEFGMQRLYYIKSGKGGYCVEGNNIIPFVPGNIYVFPSCFNQRFVTDSADPIDHLYVDFFSAPPIVNHEPLVYEVRENSPLSYIVKLIEVTLPNEIGEGRWHPYDKPHNFGKIISSEHGSDEEIFSLVYKMIELLLGFLSREKKLPLSDDKMISKTLEIIQHDYAKGVTVESLAKEAGFEVNHFIRRFKKVVGITPYVYLCRYRYSVAELFIDSGMTVTETAEVLGYSNTSTLSRALRMKKKKHGQEDTPYGK